LENEVFTKLHGFVSCQSSRRQIISYYLWYTKIVMQYSWAHKTNKDLKYLLKNKWNSVNNFTLKYYLESIIEM